MHCECGCGEETKSGNRFIYTHQMRLPQNKTKKLPSRLNVCAKCGVVFSDKTHHRAKRKFCSHQCSVGSRKNGTTQKCKECSTDIYVIPSYNTAGTGKKTFCSRACQLQSWSRDRKTAQRASTYRRNAWLHFEKRCGDCGYNSHPEILIIHHIDGNRANGKLTNLVPLCQNCHCLRHIKMTGDGRLPSYRRQRSITQ